MADYLCKMIRNNFNIPEHGINVFESHPKKFKWNFILSEWDQIYPDHVLKSSQWFDIAFERFEFLVLFDKIRISVEFFQSNKFRSSNEFQL